jgi:hypothetical protein
MRSAVLAGLLVLACAQPGLAVDRSAATPDELRRALAEAEPGTRILLAPGRYAGDFRIEASGRTEAPVTIVSADPASPAVFADGSVVVAGAHVRLERLRFENAPLVLAGAGSGVVRSRFRSFADARHPYANAVRVAPGADGAEVGWNDFTASADWNYFETVCDPDGNGVIERQHRFRRGSYAINTISLGGHAVERPQAEDGDEDGGGEPEAEARPARRAPLPRGVRIHHNLIHDIDDIKDHVRLKGYGCGLSAPIRIGDSSHQAHQDVGAVIERNLLTRLSYGDQSINVKAARGVIVRGNTLVDVDGPVVVRFRGPATIEGNVFRKSPGISVRDGWGEGGPGNHRIVGNVCHAGKIAVLAGDRPAGTKGEFQNAATGVTVADNDCPVEVGRKMGERAIVPATGTVLRNNRVHKLHLEEGTQIVEAAPAERAAAVVELGPGDVGPEAP